MADTAELKALLARVEEAGGSDDELSVQICKALTDDAYYKKHVTHSIDAALALTERVLPGWGWTISGPDPLSGFEGSDKAYVCIAGDWNDAEEPWNQEREVYEARASSPSFGIIAALLRAKIAESGG